MNHHAAVYIKWKKKKLYVKGELNGNFNRFLHLEQAGARGEILWERPQMSKVTFRFAAPDPHTHTLAGARIARRVLGVQEFKMQVGWCAILRAMALNGVPRALHRSACGGHELFGTESAFCERACWPAGGTGKQERASLSSPLFVCVFALKRDKPSGKPFRLPNPLFLNTFASLCLQWKIVQWGGGSCMEFMAPVQAGGN
jgi:hypothetical protein